MLKAQNISKKYNRIKNGSNFFFAVNPVDFELPEKTLVEIIGRSGSGKSTFLSMMAGILTPSEGKITFTDGKIGEKDLYSLSDKELSILRNTFFGVVPQGQSALSSLSVLDNVKLPALVYNQEGKSEEEIGKKAIALLERVGIGDLKDVMPNELSGGEMRRMAIARALINEPKIIFADEPTNDLDDENSRTVLELFKDIAKTASVLLVTHDTEAEKYADKIYRMDGGNLLSN